MTLLGQRLLQAPPGRAEMRNLQSLPPTAHGPRTAAAAAAPRAVSGLARSCTAYAPACRADPRLSGPAAAARRGARGRGLLVRASAAAAAAAATTGNGAPVLEPTDRVLKLWRSCNAVCLDVDCTITVNDSLDLLAEFMGVGQEVAAVTNKEHPPESRLVPGIKDLITALQARGVAVYLISGGFREMTLPIARYLGVPATHVHANRMNWQWDDETGEPTRLVGFDLSEPTAHNQGKPEAIARIRQSQPYNTIVMIGDGITDLEAVQVTGGADLFIGFGGVIQRPAVAAGADWYVTDYKMLIDNLRRYKVAMVGSGAWACAALHMVAQNTLGDDPADEFTDEVRMWVYEEEYEGRKLTEVINEEHTNPKYLPGVTLGTNVVADPDLESTVRDADIIVFCAPHQFMRGICKQLIGKIKRDAIAVSLTKGMRVRTDGPQLISQMVSKYLNIDCSVLMGANIAKDIGAEQLSEAVIGFASLENALVLKKLFQTKYFRISLLPDVAGAEMCGTLKNIVALAAGFVDGLGLGPNSKATIMRQGLIEMRAFSKALYPTIRDETFFEPCGMADLIATCYGGRNRLVAEAFTKAAMAGAPKSFDALEAELLNGQKLQGVLTSNEVQEILKARDWEADYPLFTTVNRIVSGAVPPSAVTDFMTVGSEPREGPAVDENGIPVSPAKKRTPPLLSTT